MHASIIVDVIKNIHDIDNVTEDAIYGTVTGYCVLRLCIYTYEHENMLSVTTIMANDWIYSTLEERQILRKLYSFPFKAAKIFTALVLTIVAVSVTISYMKVS